MHKTSSEARSYITDLSEKLTHIKVNCEVIAGPPFTALAAAVESAKGSEIKIAGQNLHWEEKGAFTGEISGPMLKEIGCTHVIIGHSERRQYFGETDEKVNLKISAAMSNGLVPIFCVGESLEERESGKTFDAVKKQLLGGIGDLRPPQPDNFVIAYEPVWAIGTGRTATPEQAQEVHAFLRKELAALLGGSFAASARILYGGSIKPDNTRSLIGCEDIDGGLVGGASLKVDDFLGIIKEAG